MVESYDQSGETVGERRTGSGISPWIVAVLLVLIAALLLGYFRPLFPSPLHDPDAKPRVVTARGELAPSEQATIELFQMARNSVVHITTTRLARNKFDLNLFEMPQGAGTGFLWDEQGHVVTNYHVIDGARSAYIRLFDGSTYPARYVGDARDQDIAVLKIDAPGKKLQPIVIGSSSDLKVGQSVFAIGNPFGLDQTLTTGVISGLNRQIPRGESAGSGTIKNVIQTDAAINPGNSGGPLLDSAGRLIGMNSAIYSTGGDFAGVGFAIQVDEINRVVPQLIRTGRVERIGLGITVLADEFVESRAAAGDRPRRGVQIIEVNPGGAAAKAGLEPTRVTPQGSLDWGDRIVAIDGIPVESLQDLFRILEEKAASEEVVVTVIRDGKVLSVNVSLQRLPAPDV